MSVLYLNIKCYNEVFYIGTAQYHENLTKEFLSVTIYIYYSIAHCLINVVYLTVMMTSHFLNGVANDAGSAQKIYIYLVFARLKSESTW